MRNLLLLLLLFGMQTLNSSVLPPCRICLAKTSMLTDCLSGAGESLVPKSTDEVQTRQGGRRARRFVSPVACQRRASRTDHTRRHRRRQRRRKERHFRRCCGLPQRRSAIVGAAASAKSKSAVSGLSTERRRPSAVWWLSR